MDTTGPHELGRVLGGIEGGVEMPSVGLACLPFIQTAVQGRARLAHGDAKTLVQ